MNKVAKITILSATMVAVLGTFGMVSAQEGGKHKPRFNFEQMDTNSDGFVTADEILASHNARFTEQDANNDGYLTKDEIQAKMAERAEKREKEGSERAAERLDKFFERADADKDGRIAQSEMRTPDTSKMIERLDTDGDGKISAEEAKAMKGKRKGKRKDKDEG